MEKDIIKHYTSGDLTIKWQPAKCIHSKNCWLPPKGLPAVFNPAERPWIKPENADNELIKKHIDQCPSGALSYEKAAVTTEAVASGTSIEFIENGPIILTGPIQCSSHSMAEKVLLCRCGGSGNKPYCDGSHASNGFKS